MSNAADVIIPIGATHVAWCYGAPCYYERQERQHLNQVSESWQTLVSWRYWDFQTRRWEAVGKGFCDRRLKPLKSRGI